MEISGRPEQGYFTEIFLGVYLGILPLFMPLRGKKEIIWF